MAQYRNLGLFIDGKWHAGHDRGIPVLNPADEQPLASLPVAGVEHLDLALAAAEKAFHVWKRVAPEQRYSILTRAAAILRGRVEEIARINSLEQGKTLAEARVEVGRASSIIEWDAGEAMRHYGRIVPGADGFRQMVLRQPIGPVAAFTPWNAPANSPVRKISGALAAGCSIILKAAEETPGTACAIVECYAEAGIPDGALNLVFGVPAEISSHLIASPIIRLVTFTGSVEVGRHLGQLAAKHIKPAIMELGGHAPVIVCDDVDPAKVAKMAATTKFRWAGQICVSPTRFLVQKRVHDQFVHELAQAAKSIKVGNGLEPDVHMGPLANARRLEAVDRLVRNAVDVGAKVEAGGHRIGNQGYFYSPTVLSSVPQNAEVLRSEPFGPVAPVMAFDTVSEAIATANSLPYGLASYAFTSSAETAALIADSVESGIMSINHFGGPLAELPFGGIKDSGLGREGGAESLDGYTIIKTVSQKRAA